jgi:hypothetical protein
MVFSVSRPEDNGPCPNQCQLEHRLTAIEYSLKELNTKLDLLTSNIKAQAEDSRRYARIAMYISLTSLVVLASVLVAVLVK